MSTSPRSSRRAGFSLLEIMLVFVLMAGLVVVALGGVSDGAQMVNESLAADTMRREAIQALSKIANDLKATDRGLVTVPSAAQMTLVKGTGWTAGGGQQWDPVAHVYSVSNGQLILTYVAGMPQTLANDVLAFTITPDTGTVPQAPLVASSVTFTLTLRRQVGVHGVDAPCDPARCPERTPGTPHLVTVTANRTVFVRPNL